MKSWTRLGALAIGVMLICRASVLTAYGQDTHFGPKGQQIPPPPCFALKEAWEALKDGSESTHCTVGSHLEWLKDIEHWKKERRIRIGYDGRRYDLPALKWTQSSFIQPQMMVQDRYFYDPVSHKYTVDKYLDDLESRYGGIDAVLVWPTYPNMGIDDRNQHDMLRSMPGGIPGVRQMVSDFHRRGVRVLLPMMMWDQGTHDPGMPWQDAIVDLMKQIGADGINGDTQDGVPLAFSASAERVGHPLAFEPESGPSDEALAWNVLTWGQYAYQFVPTVDKYRWLEPRHQVHIQGRWDRDKTDALQFAFFNGEGWESWENVWGIWNGITPRAGEATRRVATIERAMAPYFASEEWEPFYQMESYGVFASRWPIGNNTLWTIVNRNQYDINDRQMSVPFVEGARYFDLYHGVELHPLREQASAVLSFPTEAHGFGAILAIHSNLEPATVDLLAKMRVISA